MRSAQDSAQLWLSVSKSGVDVVQMGIAGKDGERMLTGCLRDTLIPESSNP
jgi:hypothetical protein